MKTMKTKTAYYVTAYARDEKGGGYIIDRSQYLLPNEIHLIKTMLNDGLKIMGVRKDELSEQMYKVYFG